MIMSFKFLKYFSSGKISSFLFAYQCGKIAFKLINTILYEKINTFFYKQPSHKVSNIKNGLTLNMEGSNIKHGKKFGWSLSKKFYFLNFNFTKGAFLGNFF